MTSPEAPKDSQLFEVFRSVRTEAVRVSEQFHARLRERLVHLEAEETAKVDTERVAVSGIVQIVNLALSLLRGDTDRSPDDRPKPPQSPLSGENP